VSGPVNVHEVAVAGGGDPAGYQSRGARLGPDLGAARLGGTVYELDPGESICPYHWEGVEEEWLLVLRGAPTLRDPDGEHVLAPMQLVFFPPNPDGAHLLRNDGERPVRLLMFGEVRTPSATIYPDSDKVGVWTGIKAEDVIVPRSAAVPYFHGEA
jgi:uncharacterized cupin superfamily protein